MAKLRPRSAKRAADASSVTLYQDSAGAWFAGREGDPRVDPVPMGAFISEDAARKWADASFPGGDWEPVRAPMKRT